MPDLKTALSGLVHERTPAVHPQFHDVDSRAMARLRKRRAALAGIPLVLVLAAAGTRVLGTQSPTRSTSQAPISTGATHQPVSAVPSSKSPAASRSGAVPLAGVASCVETYGLPALAQRAFAFDGTVASIVGDPRALARGGLPGYVFVTFSVHEWFRGGSGTTVTVDLFGPAVNVGHETSYRAGTRLLVSGEPRYGGGPLRDPIGWGCGFTRYYDQATATAWGQAFHTK